MARILIIDDEPQIRRFLTISLSSQGFDVITAANGREGIAQAGLAAPDLILLDLGLPDLDGQHVLRDIRSFSTVPLMVLSVRDSEHDKVTALDQGANDYVVKPFSVRELLARVRRHLSAQPVPLAREVRVQDLSIDLANHQVRLSGEVIRLSRKEYGLLACLAEHPGQLVTQAQLLRAIWGKNEPEPHYLRILVARLRARLGDDAAAPRYVETEPGVGYRLITNTAD